MNKKETEYCVIIFILGVWTLLALVTQAPIIGIPLLVWAGSKVFG